MDEPLSAVEVRVLGALLEKEHTTPDYYPLTLNALVAACNQKSSRDPVMELDDGTVLRAIDNLRDRRLAFEVRLADSRVMKYEESLAKFYQLSLQEAAVLCVLMLRGPQTTGELRGRTGRIYPFEGLDEVAVALEALAEREDCPLVTMLPLQRGRKEARYAHLLCGEPDIPEEPEGGVRMVTAPAQRASSEQVVALAEEVAALREELDGLRQDFARFKSQFD